MSIIPAAIVQIYLADLIKRLREWGVLPVIRRAFTEAADNLTEETSSADFIHPFTPPDQLLNNMCQNSLSVALDDDENTQHSKTIALNKITKDCIDLVHSLDQRSLIRSLIRFLGFGTNCTTGSH